jgi:hypothetical protein
VCAFVNNTLPLIPEFDWTLCVSQVGSLAELEELAPALPFRRIFQRIAGAYACVCVCLCMCACTICVSVTAEPTGAQYPV